MEDKRIIEINGIKMEVDMRSAKRVDEFKVGDNIKVLDKNYAETKIYNGVIVDFVNFKELPTIQIAVFETTYYGSDIKFININANTEKYEILPASRHEMDIEKDGVLERMEREMDKLKHQYDELKAKRDWFTTHYKQYFEV